LDLGVPMQSNHGSLDPSLCPVNFSAIPVLPAGLSFTKLGAIEGTPTLEMASTAINITARNAQGSTSVMLQIAVTKPLYEGQRFDIILILIGILGLAGLAAWVLQRRGKFNSTGYLELAPSESAPKLMFCDEKHNTLVLARLLLTDGSEGRKTADISTIKDLRMYSFMRSHAWKVTVWLAMGAHLLLIFPETTKPFGGVALAVFCALAEFIICGVHFIDVYLYFRLLRHSRSVQLRNTVRVLLVAGIFVEGVVSLCIPIPRFLPALRPVIVLLREKHLRETTMGIWSALPGIFVVYCFILAFLTAFSLLGVLLFVDVVENATFFVSLSGGVWNLFLVMITPWNIPTVVAPYLAVHRNLTVWFWMFFILLMVIFWMAQISSVASKAYVAYQDAKVADTDRLRVQVFSRLFQLLWWFHSGQHKRGGLDEEQRQVLTREAWTDFAAAVSSYSPVALDRFYSASCDAHGEVDRARFSQLSLALHEAPPPEKLHYQTWQIKIQRFLRYSVRVPVVHTDIILYELALGATTFAYCVCIYNEVFEFRQAVELAWPKQAEQAIDMPLFGGFFGVFGVDLALKFLAFGPCGFGREVPFSWVLLVSTAASLVFLCIPGWTWYSRAVLALSYLRVFAFVSFFEASNFVSRIIRTSMHKVRQKMLPSPPP
jgi:hypothetical protein